MWKSFVKPDKTQMTIWRVHIACWITKSTDTNSVYKLRIAFPLPNCLHESASVLRYTCDASLVLAMSHSLGLNKE